MNVCGHCNEKAEWRGFLACAEWFTGACEGDPLDVTPPSVRDMSPLGRGLEEDKQYITWLKGGH